MAKDKASFVFYCDWIDTFKSLPKEDGYDLLIHILSYVNDEDPKTDNVLVNAVFQNIKNTLKRDLKKYETRANNSRENGKKGGRPPKPKKPTGLNENPTEPKKPVSVNDSVSDSDTVSDNEIIINNNELVKLEFLNSSDIFFNEKARTKKVSIKVIKKKANEFWTNNYLGSKDKLSYNDVKRHFGNLIDKQDLRGYQPATLHVPL